MTLTEGSRLRQPDDERTISPEYDDSVSIASARFWDRPPPVFAGEGNMLKTAILMAWEDGAISGIEAFDHIDAHGLVDYDYIVSLMLDDMRMRAR